MSVALNSRSSSSSSKSSYPIKCNWLNVSRKPIHQCEWCEIIAVNIYYARTYFNSSSYYFFRVICSLPLGRNQYRILFLIGIIHANTRTHSIDMGRIDNCWLCSLNFIHLNLFSLYKRSILLQNSLFWIVYDAIMHDSSLNNCINLFIVNRVELPIEYNVKPARCPLKAINIGSLQFQMFSFYKFKWNRNIFYCIHLCVYWGIKALTYEICNQLRIGIASFFERKKFFSLNNE